MSYHVPFYMLSKAGVFQLQSNTYQQFLNSHTNVSLAVLAGDFNASTVKPSIYKKFKEEGLRSIAMIPKISGHLFVVRSDHPPKQIQSSTNSVGWTLAVFASV